MSSIDLPPKKSRVLSQRVSVYIAIFVGVVVCPEIGYEAHP